MIAHIDAAPVEVQVAIANELPTFTIVGLADRAVAESRERVRAAEVAAAGCHNLLTTGPPPRP